MPPTRLLGRRTALLGGGAVAALPLRAAAGGTTALRDLYDADGAAPSDLARSLAGRRVALTGYVAPVPTGAADWFALAETAVAPCQLCGLTHDWPVGVVAVHAPGAPHLPSPWVPVTLEGTLVLDPAARAAPGLPGTLALRGAAVAVG